MIVGLTGGIASGKTLCSDWFAARFIAIVDADIVARTLLSMGSPLLVEIADAFGKEVIADNGNLNRRALRNRIFSDDAARRWLNNLMHPKIRKELLRQLHEEKVSSYCILSAPLLLESSLDLLCDVVLAIDVSVKTQLVRGSKRDHQQQEDILAIVSAQISRQERLRRSHFIVNNEDNLAHTYLQLERLHQCFLSWGDPALS